MSKFRVTLFLVCMAVLGFMAFLSWIAVRYEDSAAWAVVGQAGGAIYYTIKRLAGATDKEANS